MVRPGSHMRDLPRGTQGLDRESVSLSLTGLSPSTAGLSMPLLLANRFVTPCGQCSAPRAGPTTPRLQRLQPITQSCFGLFRFRSPLLTECSLFLEVLRCFSSLGFLDRPMNSVERTQALPWVGFPIRRSPGDNACSQLPEAFRRLPRPSSALGAKASTARP